MSFVKIKLFGELEIRIADLRKYVKLNLHISGKAKKQCARSNPKICPFLVPRFWN